MKKNRTERIFNPTSPDSVEALKMSCAMVAASDDFLKAKYGTEDHSVKPLLEAALFILNYCIRKAVEKEDQNSAMDLIAEDMKDFFEHQNIHGDGIFSSEESPEKKETIN